MMKVIPVTLKSNPYSIIVGSRILPSLGGQLRKLKLGRDAVVVTNALINRLYGRKLQKTLNKDGFSVKFFEIPDSEKSKSASIAIDLLNRIASYDQKKNIFMIALGGGVVGDLAGFVAAIYKRGVPFIQVPTTLLAQIDSAIGGKTGIDLSQGKNLVGAFYQPKLVFSDVSLLSTLPARQIKSGLSEAVKYGVIHDKRLFEFIENKYLQLLSCQANSLTQVVLRCSQIKADVVTKDEKETKGIRTILNFGHTVGHALEAASGYRLYSHGEAIALGMRVAGEISKRSGLCTTRELDRLNQVLTKIGLPTKIVKVSLSKILFSMQHDKKFKGSTNRFVLLTQIGKVTVREGIAMDVILRSIKALMGSLRR